MNLFDLFIKMTHPPRRFGWVETVGYFTGESRHVQNRKGNRYTMVKRVNLTTEPKEFAIRYYVGDKVQIGWYMFYPEMDMEDINGVAISIRYKKSRPWIFEVLS